MSNKIIQIKDSSDNALPINEVSGSSVNGSYVKFPDGTMIQWGAVTGQSFSNEDMISGTKTMAAYFYDTNYQVICSSNTSGVNGYIFRVGANPSTTASFNWNMATQSAITTSSRGFLWIAIGRWKA